MIGTELRHELRRTLGQSFPNGTSDINNQGGNLYSTPLISPCSISPNIYVIKLQNDVGALRHHRSALM